MQSALDLADSGYYIYLLEKSPCLLKRKDFQGGLKSYYKINQMFSVMFISFGFEKKAFCEIFLNLSPAFLRG